MDNGLKGLLETERAKLMQQVAAIDAILGRHAAPANGNGNGLRRVAKSAPSSYPKRHASGVSTAILAEVGASVSTVSLTDVAARLKARGVYPATLSNRKLASRTATALYRLQALGKIKRVEDGTWGLVSR
jgi:hypothetical protein